MKLSILTATFNRGDLLQRLYESIINNLKTKLLLQMNSNIESLEDE